jgi:hypothetical protein
MRVKVVPVTGAPCRHSGVHVARASIQPRFNEELSVTYRSDDESDVDVAEYDG